MKHQKLQPQPESQAATLSFQLVNCYYSETVYRGIDFLVELVLEVNTSFGVCILPWSTRSTDKKLKGHKFSHLLISRINFISVRNECITVIYFILSPLSNSIHISVLPQDLIIFISIRFRHSLCKSKITYSLNIDFPISRDAYHHSNLPILLPTFLYI